MGNKTRDERIAGIIEVISRVARGDYSVQAELSGQNDEIDSLALGINMMIDDITSLFNELNSAKELLEKKVTERTTELENKIKELKDFNDLAVGREIKMIALEKELKKLKNQPGQNAA